jgi:spoIIIJ-associated protein
MIRVEAKNLKEAYQKAATELNCSVTDLKIEIIQKANPVILGFLKKKAIIVAVYDPNAKNEKKGSSRSAVATKKTKPQARKEEEVKREIKRDKKSENKEEKTERVEKKKEKKESKPKK